jgi:hypothetical protein
MPMSIAVIAIGGMFFSLAVVWLICRTILDAIRSRHASRAGWDKDGNVATPPMFERMLDKAMRERDEHQRSLEERIEVLEKIVTDGHKASSLADEIERLRDKA